MPSKLLKNKPKMKIIKSYFLLLLFFIPFTSYEQTDTSCIIIKGDTATGLFKQLILDSKFDYLSDTSQAEIVSAAWTCNALGYPTCNFRDYSDMM